MFKAATSVGNPSGGDLTPASAVVDINADHSMLPAARPSWHDLAPLERMQFMLADGSRQEYGAGIAWFNIAGRERPGPVVFEPDEHCLLGVSALGIFNLTADPPGQCLIPEERRWPGPGGAMADALPPQALPGITLAVDELFG